MSHESVQKQIDKIIESYERTLVAFLEKGERFDSSPFTLSLQALNKMLEDKE